MTVSGVQEAKSHFSTSDTQHSLWQRLATGVAWNVLGTAFAQGGVFAANILVANQLGPGLFGEFSLLQNTALTFSAIAQVATGATATRYVAQFRSADPARAGRILGFCTLFTLLTGLTSSLLLFFFSDWLSLEAISAPQISDGLKIMAVYLLFSVMSGFQIGALAGLEGHRRIAQLGALHAVVHVSLSAIAVWMYGLQGALWAVVISLVVRWWLYHQGIRQEARRFNIPIAYAMQKGERRSLLQFSLPAALAGLTATPALWFANVYLVKQPMGFSQLGLLAAALNLKTIVMLVPTIVSSVGGVLVHSHSDQNDRARYRKAYLLTIATSLAAFGCAGLTVFLLSDLLLSYFGEGFRSAKPLVEILIVAALIETLMLSMYQLVYSLERMWWSFFAMALPRDLVFLASAFLMIPSMQVDGVAWAHVLGSGTALIAVVYFVARNRRRLSAPGGNDSMQVQSN